MSAPTKDKGTAAQQPQLLKILEGLLKLPENRECVDCGTKAPRWASTNLGVFMCIRCSGIHRSLGVHISKVKSVSLDKWSPEQVEFMQQMGNAKAKEIYEAYVPHSYNKGAIMTENIALEQWIRDKYERKRFMDRNGAEPVTRKEYKESHNRGHYRDGESRDRGQYRDGDRESYREGGREPHKNDRESYRDGAREPHRSDRETYKERENRNGREAKEPSTEESREYVINKPQAPHHHENHAPAKQAPPPVAAVPQQSTDLLDFDAPVQLPSSASPQHNDFFGDFASAGDNSAPSPAPANTPNAAPVKDKNAILQLYNAPPVVPSYGVPHGMPHPHVIPQGIPHPHYPPANYNIHLQPGAGYIPNGYGMGVPPNYNIGMGRGMPPNYNMGVPVGVNYYNTTPPAAAYNPPPGYGAHPQYGAPLGYAGSGNPNNLINGLNNLNLRM